LHLLAARVALAVALWNLFFSCLRLRFLCNFFWVDLHAKWPMQDKLEFSGFPPLTGFQFVCKNILPFIGEP